MSTADQLSRKDTQAIDAAKLYYGGLSQNEVADQLGVSRPTVSKLLQHASQRGFVTITVHDPRVEDTSVTDALMKTFSLSDVRIVYPASDSPEEIRETLSDAAARKIEEIVRDGDAIGVSWSRTVQQISKKLHRFPRKNASVVQLRGGIAGLNRDLSEIATLHRFAQAFDAEPYLLGMPTVFESVQVKLAVERERQIMDVLERGRQCRIAVFTVGNIDKNSYLLDLPALTSQDRQYLQSHAVGDICSRFVDTHGRICLPDLNNRTMAISLPHLRKVPQKVMVAGGQEKAEIIKVVLENGYVDHLVIDDRTAQSVLQMVEKQ